jgi:hypothetical protein
MVTRRKVLRAGVAGLTTGLLSATALRNAPASAATGSPDDVASDAAWGWFELLFDVVKGERLPPTRASRLYGLAAVALYESVIDGSAVYDSFCGRLNGLVRVQGAGSTSLHWPAAVGAAMAGVIGAVIPAMSPASQSALAAGAAISGGGAPQSAVDAGTEHGRAIASAVMTWAAHDLSNRPPEYQLSHTPPAWRPTPPAFAAVPLDSDWGANRPMLLSAGDEFPPAGHPGFSTAPESAFFRAAQEVYETGRMLTAEQKYIADFWADNPGATATPPGHWIAIVSQLARNRRLSLVQAARAYAAVGIAIHDAFIACWRAKYETNLLRPVTYIRDYIDAGWSSYIPTPAFPSYTSGHSTQSAAAATVLTALLGRGSFSDTTHVDHATVPALGPRSFASFEQAAAEAMVSRLYGGIHYAFDNEDGLAAGLRIGTAVVERLALGAL